MCSDSKNEKMYQIRNEKNVNQVLKCFILFYAKQLNVKFV